MESAPQSTITHNAVIEFASDPDLAPRHDRGRGGRIKRRPALPKRAASNRRDHAKIVSPAQRSERPSRAFLRPQAAVFASDLAFPGPTARERRRRRPEPANPGNPVHPTQASSKMTVGQSRQGDLLALFVEQARRRRPLDDLADHGDRNTGGLGGLFKGFKARL